MLCKYLAPISVTSSVQVTLQFYFQPFYSIAPNKTVIKLTQLKRQAKDLEDIKQLVIKNTFSGRNHGSMLLWNKCRKKVKKTSTTDLLNKTTS